MKRGPIGAAALLALTLADCAPFPPIQPAPMVYPTLRGSIGLPPAGGLPLNGLPGWAREDHAAAYAAYRRTCAVAADPAATHVCQVARALGDLNETAARAFLESRFVAATPSGEGLLTAYFTPRYDARHQPDGEFTAPVRPLPSDLQLVDADRLDPGQSGRRIPARAVDGVLAPYPDRARIEADAPVAPLAWMRPEDLFFLQVQGSGVLAFEDGERAKAAFAGSNGRAYVAIARPMREAGFLAADDTSAQAVHAWLAAHRGPEADAVMRLNPRYAFFRLAPDDGGAPSGSAGVPLPARRAVAIDPAYHPMGELLWIDASQPALPGAVPRYQGLAMALDTGAAIRGRDRADLYMGAGAAAGEEAGRVRHELHLYRLVPKADAR